MDTDKEAVQNEPDSEENIQSDSPKPEVPEDPSRKRKLEDDDESENGDSNKRVKMEEKPVSDVKDDAADGEDSSKTSVKDSETSVEGKAKPPTPDCAGDQKSEDEKGSKAESDLTEDAKQEEKMEEKEVTDPKEEEEIEKVKAVIQEEKAETVKEEEDNSEVKQLGSDSKPVSKTEEEEKDAEASARRYPTRGNRGEQKAASDLAGSSGAEDSSEKDGGKAKKEEAKETSKSSPEEEDSIKSDGGSDKENLNGDAPMDLSNAGTPEVIMLSDEEETPEQKKRTQEQLTKLRKRVRHLQSELRNEEAKLVLLKKLRQSQLAPPIQEHPPMSGGSNSSHASKQSLPRQPGGPPPLVRGSQQGRGPSLHAPQQQGRSSAHGQVRNMQGPPPLVGTQRGGPNSVNGNSSQGIRGSHLGQHGSSNHRAVQQQQTAQHQQASTPPQPPVDTQTPAQRQAAAKLALRKQLEKTLLQIPPPKPPAPEMNFIPSLACPDFVLLLGLEEVVNHIIDLQLIARGQKSPDEKFICNPFTCVQCGTDYTPVWKREKPGSKNVICEHCVTWNQKRALKQEHTNRLKSAFVKALQQEQEIERMQAPSTPSTPTPSATPPASMPSAPPQALAAAAAASSVAAAAAMSMNPSFRASAEQVRQHHNFLQQAHQAQLRAGQPLAGLQGFGARAPFPYTLPYVKQADLQRQYLLDMIPRAGMPWKP